MEATSRCPRCGGGFRCEAAAGQPGPCDCFAVRVPEAARRLLRERYTACVCVHCLRELAAHAEPDSAPTDLTPPAVPGRH